MNHTYARARQSLKRGKPIRGLILSYPNAASSVIISKHHACPGVRVLARRPKEAGFNAQVAKERRQARYAALMATAHRRGLPKRVARLQYEFATGMPYRRRTAEISNASP